MRNNYSMASTVTEKRIGTESVLYILRSGDVTVKFKDCLGVCQLAERRRCSGQERSMCEAEE